MNSPFPSLDKLSVTVVAPDLAGGGTTRVFLLAQTLQTIVGRVQVVGLASGSEIYPQPPDSLPITAIPGWQLPNSLTGLPAALRAIDGDLIYAIKPKLTSYGLALLKQRFQNQPVLLDIDDWELSWLGGDRQRYRPSPRQLVRDIVKPEGALRDPDHRLYLEWIERLIPEARAITVDTQFLQKRFGGTYLPNGKNVHLFDPERFDAEATRGKYHLSDYRILMFPGTARPHKGLEDVLVALEHLAQPDLRLAIVGGRRPDNYDDYLLETWGQWIIRLPRFPANQMPEVVSAAHIVVVPQRQTETAQAQCPIKLTDGMAMAKPIISTRVGDIPTVLGDTGFLVNPNSPLEIAAQIEWIFDQWPEACARGQRARERCVQHYSLEAMAETLRQVLTTALYDRN
jgi:glycosyltransferase involved in cell wall biosynthesis